MADIDIQRKTTPVWPWILGIIIVVAIILFMVAGRDKNQMENVGGGPHEQENQIPGQTINPPSPARPDAPNRPDGSNPQVAPATPDQPPAQANPPAQNVPSEPTQPTQPTQPNGENSNKTKGGASLAPQSAEPVFTNQLAQQNQDSPEPSLTPPGDEPAGEDVIIIENDQPDDSLVLDEQYPPEVTAFSQFLIQNTGTQAELSNTFTADGLRNISDALYALSEQENSVVNSRDQNHDEINQIADQIATVPNDNEQAKLTADAFTQVAQWMYEVSETLYPTSQSQAQAVLEAADNFDPEAYLSTQLPAVRAFFDRADSALQNMAA